MEEVELNKNNKKRPQQGMSDNQKGWLVFGCLTVISFFGGFYLLFLSSEQEKLASELAQEIKAFEGEGYQQKVSALLRTELGSFTSSNEEAQESLSSMISSLNYNATFSPIKEFSDSEFGGVEIATAKINNSISEDNYTDVVIKKKPSEPKTYYFSYNGESKQLLDDPRLVENPRASIITKFLGAEGLLKLNDSNQIETLKNELDEVSFTDGSGSVTYVTMENVNAEFSKNFSADSSDFSIKLSAEKVDFGEALKFMLGAIKPMQINFDMQYSGDSLTKLEKISESNVDSLAKYLQEDPQENLAEISAAEKYNGHIQLKDFQLMSGEMGFISNANLEFKGFPYAPVPVGELNFTIKNYNQIIAYLRNFFPIPEEEVQKTIADASAYFVNDGANLVFQAIFDGTRIVQLGNGKTMDILKKPETPWPSEASTQNNGYRSEFDTPVESDSKAVQTPVVQQKELK